MRDERDEAIDRALKALGGVAAPAGLEARVVERMERAPAVMERDAATRAWWMGAVCGAAVATLAIGVVILARHQLSVPPRVSEATVRVAAGPSAVALDAAYVRGSATANGRGAPCAMPGLRPVQRPVASPGIAAPISVELLAATVAPSKPAPELPLTAQERELVRLARTGDAKELAPTLNEEAQAKLEVEDKKEFERFFTPPPAPPEPAIEENE